MASTEKIRTTGEPEYNPNATGPEKTVVEISNAPTDFQIKWANMDHQNVLEDIYAKIASIRGFATTKDLQKVTHITVAYHNGSVRITLDNLVALGVMNAHKVTPRELHKYVHKILVNYLATPGLVPKTPGNASSLRVTMVCGTTL